MNYPKLVEKIKNSVAVVIALDTKKKIIHKGSGFIFSKKGILVTCNHLLKDTNKVLIKFLNSSYIEAKIAIEDKEHDLVLLRFDDKTRKPIPMSDNTKVKVGMPVVFSGYPLDLEELTTHQGVLSAITKDATGVITYLIDGTVNAGNSGCPLMNSTGEVIGIVNAKRRERSILLNKVEKMSMGAISLHDTDLVEILQAIIENLQLGIGYAVPVGYIPQHKEIKNNLQTQKIVIKNKNNKKVKKT